MNKKILVKLTTAMLTLFIIGACSQEETTILDQNAIETETETGTEHKDGTLFVGSTVDETANPTRCSFDGNFPGTPGQNNVKFYWDEDDEIYISQENKAKAAIKFDKTTADFFFNHQSLTEPAYTIYYPGQNATAYNKVKIETKQEQSRPNDTRHVARSGDCGVARADRGEDGVYRFKLEHKAAFLCFLPRTENPLINDFVIKSVKVMAEYDIGGEYTLTENGLQGGSSKEIMLELKDFKLGNTTNQDRNAAYMVIAPSDKPSGLTVVYTIYNPTTGQSGTVAKAIPPQVYKANTVYPLTARLVEDYSREIKRYMWDAKEDYWYGIESPSYIYPNFDGYGGGEDRPKSKESDPLRWYNDEFNEGRVTYAQYSAKDCPTLNKALWYIEEGDMYMDFKELWSANGKLYKGVIRFKKWDAMVREKGAAADKLPEENPEIEGWIRGTPEFPYGRRYKIPLGPPPADYWEYLTIPGAETESKPNHKEDEENISNNFDATYWLSNANYAKNGPYVTFKINYYPRQERKNDSYCWVSRGDNYLNRERSMVYRAMKFE